MSNPLKSGPLPVEESFELLEVAFANFAIEHGCNLSTLVQGYINTNSQDGYKLAKYYDLNYGWDCDMEFAEQLCELGWLERVMVMYERKQWIEKYNIQPPYDIGTQLTKGKIVGIDEYSPGYYLVEQPNDSIGKLLIKFEEAELHHG